MNDVVLEQEAIVGDTSDLLGFERIIERGLQTFVEVGQALIEIRDRRLYKLSHQTFEDYCQERWGLARRTAYQYIEASEVVANIEQNVRNCAHLPANEAQARPLVSLPPEQQVEVWQKAVETAPRDSEGSPRVTAKHVASVATAPVPPADGLQEPDLPPLEASEVVSPSKTFSTPAVSPAPQRVERVKNDYYPTPDAITRILLKYIQPGGVIVEPCAGHGAIAGCLPSGVWTNEPYPPKDFEPDSLEDATDSNFWETLVEQVGEIDWVITNPPYGSLVTPILANGLRYSRRVAMLLRLSYLEPCEERAAMLQEYESLISHVIILNPRPQFRLDVPGTDNITSAWVVWQQHYASDRRVVFETHWK